MTTTVHALAGLAPAEIIHKDLPSHSPFIRATTPAPNGRYWRVRKITTLTHHESGDLPNVFVRCWRGEQRVVGVRVKFFWPSGSNSNGLTEAKDLDEWGDWSSGMTGDWVTEHGSGPFGVEIVDGALPSEAAMGMGLPRSQHYAFIVEFEEVEATVQTFEETIRAEARRVRLPLDRNHPITNRLLQDGLIPTSTLFTFAHGGASFTAQCALKGADNSNRVYYRRDNSNDVIQSLAF